MQNFAQMFVLDFEVLAEPDKKQHFWTTLPGVLTGIAALLTARRDVSAWVCWNEGWSAGGGFAPRWVSGANCGGRDLHSCFGDAKATKADYSGGREGRYGDQGISEQLQSSFLCGSIRIEPGRLRELSAMTMGWESKFF
jgi:hypothetical protein